MKVHQVIWRELKPNLLQFNSLSCFEKECLHSDRCCQHYFVDKIEYCMSPVLELIDPDEPAKPDEISSLVEIKGTYLLVSWTLLHSFLNFFFFFNRNCARLESK